MIGLINWYNGGRPAARGIAEKGSANLVRGPGQEAATRAQPPVTGVVTGAGVGEVAQAAEAEDPLPRAEGMTEEGALLQETAGNKSSPAARRNTAAQIGQLG